MRQNDLEADKCNRPENLSPVPHRPLAMHSRTWCLSTTALYRSTDRQPFLQLLPSTLKTLTATTSKMLQKNNVCKFNPNQKHQILNAGHLSLCCKDKGSKDPSE